MCTVLNLCFSKAFSLAGKKMHLRAKNKWINGIDASQSDCNDPKWIQNASKKDSELS